MTETLTITQMIAEEKNIFEQIKTLIRSDFSFVTFYLKNSPYVGARTSEQAEADQKEKFQKLCDLIRRFKAIRKAHTEANRTTMVTVPVEPDLGKIASGKFNFSATEEITIAEAINRKNIYKGSNNPIGKAAISFIGLSGALLDIFDANCRDRKVFETRAAKEVDARMSRMFPVDSKNQWSTDKYKEAKKKEEEEVEVVMIDPNNLVETNTIVNYANAIRNYLNKIDVILSEVNAATKVTVEY